MLLPKSLFSRSAAASLLIILGSVCVVAWAVGARGGVGKTPQPAAPSRPHAPARAAGPSNDVTPAYRAAVRVWVHRDGVRPAVMRAEPGPVTLHAENETGGDVALVLERVIPGQGARRAARVATNGRGKRSRQELELGAGEYLFYEESRPQLKGRLVVEQGAR